MSYGRESPGSEDPFGQFVVAENRLLDAAMVLSGWYQHCLKEGIFTQDDLSEPEIEFLSAIKGFRKKRAAHRKHCKTSTMQSYKGPR